VLSLKTHPWSNKNGQGRQQESVESQELPKVN
jgi:hypothetical protein